jgi:outer membrane protein TolC
MMVIPMTAQRVLSLDSCRQMALQNNKQLGISKLKQNVASNIRKSARTKYLPHISAIGTYEHTSEAISLLNDAQKKSLPQMGTEAVGGLQPQMAGLENSFAQMGNAFVQLGVPPAQVQGMMGDLQKNMTGLTAGLQQILNAQGQQIVDALNTDTRNVWAGSILFTQPIFMGGSIIALNKMADINERIAENTLDARRQATLYHIDMAYWQVVSLHHKKQLAESYLDLVKKLDSDVHKMIDEGVATRSDGLSVDVKVNEAEMAVTQAEDGLALAKMLLCQQCGLPIDSSITLEDENKEDLATVGDMTDGDIETALVNRYELEMLGKAVDISKESTRLLRAAYLPQVALTGGYLVTNPSVYNGFEHKFGGVWNIGILIRVPVWSWQEATYKIRASKAATNIANMELAEATELIELQVNQSQFKMREANKKYGMSLKNVEKAEENLRCANLGFAEGVMTATEVMEAQTAWLQAQTQKIDAEIDLRLSQIGMKKALGVLQ